MLSKQKRANRRGKGRWQFRTIKQSASQMRRRMAATECVCAARRGTGRDSGWRSKGRSGKSRRADRFNGSRVEIEDAVHHSQHLDH
jgi:hypothetical protein